MGATLAPQPQPTQQQREQAWANQKNNEANDAYKREVAWGNRAGPEGERERLLRDQKNQKALDDAQKKNALELTSALKFQKQFAATTQGKNGTLLTNPGANGIAIAPSPGQKTLLGQ